MEPVDRATILLWARKECADRGIAVQELSDDDFIEVGSDPNGRMPWHVKNVLATYRQRPA